jgi:nitrite reductase/ring-hydroxylating ferredoxin subunit
MQAIMDVKQEKDFIHMNKLISCIAIIALAFTLQQCKKNTDTSDFFPPVLVKTQLNLNLPQYLTLQNPQGFVYLPEGNKGIVVFHLPQGGYVAYDRTCSYNPKDACAAVTMDRNLSSLRCGKYATDTTSIFTPCCASKFDLNTGIALEKPASVPLKSYYTSYDETQKILYVSSSPF